MLNKKIFAYSLLLFGFSSLFAMSGEKNYSFDEIEEKYPSEEYFVGVGHASNLSNAESSAKLSICQILGEKIAGEQETFQYSSSDGKEESSLTMNINETVLFNHITGIEIKESFQKSDGNFFAIAVLNKKNAANYYSTLAKQNGNKIAELIDHAQKVSPSFEAVKILQEAAKQAEENQYNLDLLFAIDQTKAKMTFVPYISLQNVQILLNQNAKELKVKIEVDGDKNELIQKAIENSLVEQGISVVNEGGNYLLKAQFSSMQLDSLDGVNNFVRYNFNYSLEENKTQKIVKSSNTSGREGHKTFEGAENRCYSKVKLFIEENL